MSSPHPHHRLLKPLRARDPHEPHRVASPLELFTDLCFVVAVAQAAAELHHAVLAHHLAHGVLSFGMVFFAIWWAWLNFTWFGSAYDNDDTSYRLLTLLQIFGSLVLAAGVHRMFEGDFTLAVIGYVLMRVGLVIQWLRAAKSDPARRTTCRRYAGGVAFVQLLWVAYLWVPPALGLVVFGLLTAAEFGVVIYAERAGMTPWHPHHVAERYSLLFLIVLGESVLSTTVAIQQSLNEGAAGHSLLYVVVGSVLILFSCWWLYFTRSAAPALERAFGGSMRGTYLWGFGHYFIFAAGAALGAGLASRVDFWTRAGDVSALQTAALVTVPVCVLLAVLWVVHLRPHDPSFRTLLPFCGAIALILAATFTPVPELVTGGVCALLLTVELRLAKPAARSHA